MILVDGLTSEAGRFRLRKLSFSVAEGEGLALLGPSGAGKSLAMESILGLRPLTTGRIVLGGRDVSHAPPEERGFAYVPQDLALFPHLGVEGNLCFCPRLHGLSEGEVAERLRQVTSLLGIEALVTRRHVEGLSGGEQQRVALARALMARPRLLVLDEAFSSLDGALRHELVEEVDALRRRLGFTLLLVTHDLDEALFLCSDAVLLKKGETVARGDLGRMLKRPPTLWAARFLMMENLWPWSGEGQCLPGAPPRSDEAKDWIGIRASALEILGPEDPAPEGRVTIPAVLRELRTSREGGMATVVADGMATGVADGMATGVADGMATGVADGVVDRVWRVRFSHAQRLPVPGAGCRLSYDPADLIPLPSEPPTPLPGEGETA